MALVASLFALLFRCLLDKHCGALAAVVGIILYNHLVGTETVSKDGPHPQESARLD